MDVDLALQFVILDPQIAVAVQDAASVAQRGLKVLAVPLDQRIKPGAMRIVGSVHALNRRLNRSDALIVTVEAAAYG